MFVYRTTFGPQGTNRLFAKWGVQKISSCKQMNFPSIVGYAKAGVVKGAVSQIFKI